MGVLSHNVLYAALELDIWFKGFRFFFKAPSLKQTSGRLRPGSHSPLARRSPSSWFPAGAAPYGSQCRSTAVTVLVGYMMGVRMDLSFHVFEVQLASNRGIVFQNGFCIGISGHQGRCVSVQNSGLAQILLLRNSLKGSKKIGAGIITS
jgi:hypothetical protein